MASTILLRRKIKSVTNTKQITKAMQMVAASKMQRAQEAAGSTRSYAETAGQIIDHVEDFLVKDGQIVFHPLLAVRPIAKVTLVVISSDRGLAGAYNSNILRQTLDFLKINSDKQIDIVTVGRKIRDSLTRLNIPLQASFTDFAGKPTSNDIVPIAKLTIDAFLAEQTDSVTLIYTRFHSTLKQTVETETILPIEPPQKNESTEQPTHELNYLFEPAAEEVLDYILPRIIEVRFLRAILDSVASEHSARMIAMKSATDNATDLIDDLRLTYNSVRQAAITQEIAEISAGTMAG